MPKLPESGRIGRRASRRTGVAALALAGLVGFYLFFPWPGAEEQPPDSDSPLDRLATALSSARRELAAALSKSAPETADDTPRPGSMQAYLLGTADADRSYLLWRAITDAGFVCTELRTAGAVGTTGSAWRANCGEGHVFWVDIDDFGRLSATPMPYGDISPSARPSIVTPEGQGRTLELRERELE